MTSEYDECEECESLHDECLGTKRYECKYCGKFLCKGHRIPCDECNSYMCLECWQDTKKHLCMRTCFFCGALLSLEGVINQNEDLNLKYLVSLWDDHNVNWLCCTCFIVATSLKDNIFLKINIEVKPEIVLKIKNFPFLP